MRKSNVALSLLSVVAIFLVMLFVHAKLERQRDRASLDRMISLVRKLELTDLCLFTEARYTRHLSQSDFFSAFQDHPGALEHFPAGSLAGPSPALRRFYGRLD